MATEKFKAVVHYIVAGSGDPQRLGATRLNKICWFSDTTAYRLLGQSISGESYVKRPRGPVPRAILHAIRELEQEGKIHVRDKDLGRYKMRMFVALEEPDGSVFSDIERDILNEVIGDICDNHTADSISDASHDRIWDAANEGEEIPLCATLAARDAELTQEVIEWADSVVKDIESREEAA